MANIVAIVGRPNVGKSTFFNRLIEDRQAIMDDMPGVTRDRHYGYAEWTGNFFTVIDTGGYVHGSDDKFESQIRRQVELALEECTAVIFMVDCRTGPQATTRNLPTSSVGRRNPCLSRPTKPTPPIRLYPLV